MTTVRLADYVANTVAAHGLRHVFMLTGGGAMYLNDALGHHPSLTTVCCHHEQACAFAAEGYARIAGVPALVSVTTGPGGINALNGVFAAWTDSIPMVVVSGQVKRDTLMATYDVSTLRQLGDQEVDIVAMARGISKYCRLVSDPLQIGYELGRALFLATHGRPGPVWLDIPIDVQSASVDPAALRAYASAEDTLVEDPAVLEAAAGDVRDRIAEADRPVILVGSGVRLAGALDLLDRVAGRLGVPVALAWTAPDALPTDHPLYAGRPGSVGDRPGNFAVQNADFLLVLGSRLNIRQVSYNWKAFARHALIAQVDVDEAELRKPTVRPQIPIHADIHTFMAALDSALTQRLPVPGRHAGWLAWCRERVAQYPVVLPRHREGSQLNPYLFTEELFARLSDDDVVVCGDGTACVVTFQAAVLRRGQRLWCNSGDASMGYDLPAAIGAAVARGGKRVICLAGDGSLQLNVQELQTLVHHRLPVLLFVLNNGGYLSIRQSQEAFFGRFVGEGPASGVSFPDMCRVAEAYGIPARRLVKDGLTDGTLDAVLAADGPLVCEVLLDPAQPFEPKLSSKPLPDGRIVSPPLEDLWPFLDREELRANMVVPVENEWP